MSFADVIRNLHVMQSLPLQPALQEGDGKEFKAICSRPQTGGRVGGLPAWGHKPSSPALRASVRMERCARRALHTVTSPEAPDQRRSAAQIMSPPEHELLVASSAEWIMSQSQHVTLDEDGAAAAGWPRGAAQRGPLMQQTLARTATVRLPPRRRHTAGSDPARTQASRKQRLSCSASWRPSSTTRRTAGTEVSSVLLARPAPRAAPPSSLAAPEPRFGTCAGDVPPDHL